MLTFRGWLGFVSLSPAVLSTGWEGHSLSFLFWTPIPVALSAHGPIWRVQKCPTEHLLHVLRTWQASSAWISPGLKGYYFFGIGKISIWEGTVAVSSSQKAPERWEGTWHRQVPTQHTHFQNCSFKAPGFSSCLHRELSCLAKDSAVSCRNQKVNS